MSAVAVPPVHTLIWLSVKPLIKLVIPAGAGFFITKAGLFTSAASRGAAQIILNVTLPSLLFSKIIPSFTPDNISAIGPIFLTAVVYIGLSLIFSSIIRTVFPTARNFRWGILAAGGWSNWGDLPTSVVSTVTLSAPFRGTADSNLAIAYVAIFILVFYVTLFPMRGTCFIEWDYSRLPAEDDEELLASGVQWRDSASRLSKFIKRRGHRASPSDDPAAEKEQENEKQTPLDATSPPAFPPLDRIRTSRQADLRRVATHRSQISVQEAARAAAAPSFEDTEQRNRRALSFRSQQKFEAAERERLQTIVASRAGSVFEDEGSNDVDDETAVGSSRDSDLRNLPVSHGGETSRRLQKEDEAVERRSNGASEGQRWTARRVALGAVKFVRSLLTPPTISLVSAIVIALVNPLKALFTTVENYSFHPVAPDGDPPLAIILDTATFMGNASVPLGLFVLGAALARMTVPRPFSKLPLASIFALAIAKLIILPLIGFFFVKALCDHTNLVARENRVLRFVLVYFSCVPTATTQVALTQIYAPIDGESNSDILAAYLIVQYAIFSVSSVVLSSFTLNSLF